MTLLTGAVVLFGIFHFLPSSTTDETFGWETWPGVFLVLQDASTFEDPLLSMVLASFLMLTLLILASPFLGNVWNKSKPAWAMAVGCSGLAAAGLWITILIENEAATLLPGLWCLMFAPVLNFSGLVLARGKPAPASPLPPARVDAD